MEGNFQFPISNFQFGYYLDKTEQCQSGFVNVINIFCTVCESIRSQHCVQTLQRREIGTRLVDFDLMRFVADRNRSSRLQGCIFFFLEQSSII